MRVVFETATIADCIKKAAAVAPAKGAAFDKAAGVVLEIATDTSTVRATNTEVFYQEWIDTVSIEDGPFQWRLPAQLLASVLNSLPIGSGSQVSFEQKENTVHISQGRTRVKINLLPIEYYPIWTAFDPDGLVEAGRLSERIKQVVWAASSNLGDTPLCGVHLDGEIIVATDRYRCATVPLEIPDLEQPLTVPGHLLVNAIQKSTEVKLGTEGQHLLILPDEFTQIRSVCYGQAYPNVRRIMTRDSTETITLNRTQLIEIINRAMNFAGSERVPSMDVLIGQGEIAVMMSNTEVGMLGDVVEVPGFADHKRKRFVFTPKNLLDGLTASPNEQVTIGYFSEKPNKPFHIDGGSGYEAWIAPRADNA